MQLQPRSAGTGRGTRPGAQWSDQSAYLVAGLGIEQDPAEFNDLGGVLGDIDAMFVAGRGDVDDDVAVQLGDGGRDGGHVSLCPGEVARGRGGERRGSEEAGVSAEEARDKERSRQRQS